MNRFVCPIKKIVDVLNRQNLLIWQVEALAIKFRAKININYHILVFKLPNV